MFRGLTNLIVLAELVLCVPVVFIVIALIIKDPLGGLLGVSAFALLCSRIVHHWRRS